MGTRRVLVALIALLSVLILVGGSLVAGLTVWRLVGQSRGNALLVMDSERRLRLLDAQGNERVLADDLSGDLFRYPAAAPDGERVAFVSRDTDDLVLISMHLRTGERTELYRSDEAPPLYLTWSPDSSTISFLSNRREGGLGIHTVAADGSAEASLLSVSPGSSYYAWQPNSQGLLLHVGGSRFENGSVQVFNSGVSEPVRELRDPGFFQSPAWSVDGSSFFYVAQPPVEGPLSPESVESVLTRVAADGEAEPLATERGAAIFFSRAPTNDAIAYITAGPNRFGALKLIDGPGDALVVSRPDEQIPAFFWSPNGEQLAYLTFEATQNGPPQLTWHVVERGSGEIRDLTAFTPSQAFMGMLTYFDAYAFTLDLWSPDSSTLIYGTDEGIYSVNVGTGDTTRRGDGVLATWAR
jgi:TolB protein